MRQLQLSADQLRVIAPSEFAYFSRYFAEHPLGEIPAEALPPGWTKDAKDEVPQP